MNPRIRQRRCALRIFAKTLVFLPVLAGLVQGQSHWEVRPGNVNSPLNAVAFGNGLFVAVGDNGVIVTSPDGSTWTPRVSGTTTRLPALAFGNGRFVATCANRNVTAITSQDGVNWTPVAVTDANGAPAESSAFSTIAFGGGRFLAAGIGPESNEIMGSADGSSFQTINPAAFPFGLIQNLTYFRGQFYAFAGFESFYASSDGVTWNDPLGWDISTSSAVAITDQISKVAILKSGSAVFSEDAGHNFQESEEPVDYYRPPPEYAPVFRAGCYGAGTFVAVDTKAGTWTSVRGQYWLPRGRFGPMAQEFRGVVFDGVGRFVAVGAAYGVAQALIATAASDPPTPRPPTFRVRKLTTQLSTPLSEVRGINHAGVVAGAIRHYPIFGNTVAAIVRDGYVTTWDGPSSWGFANAVSDDGVAAVEVSNPPIRGAALFASGEAVYPIYPNADTSAGDISPQGMLVGYYQNRTTGVPAGIYRYNTATRELVDLGNLGRQSIFAFAINDRNDIAGVADGVAYKLSQSGEMLTLPNLGGPYVWVTSINALGDVAGFANMPLFPQSPINVHTCPWRDGIPTDLDTFSSRQSITRGMNNLGDVVGYFTPPGIEPFHAFVSTSGVMHDLNALLDGSGDGWVLTSADGINDSRQIAGMGLHHGQPEPYVADPVPGSPAGTQTRFVNVSTRLKAGAGDNVLIGGFILQGGAKRVVVRAMSSTLFSVPNRMEDPTLELLDGAGQRIAFNDNFDDLPYEVRGEIGGYHLEAPYGQRDSVLIATLESGNYTAVVRGNNGGTGNCLVEVYNVDSDYTEALVNISTRGPVEDGDNVMIGGFIIRGDREQRVIVRAIGPSLATLGVPGALSDTTLEVFDGRGRIAENDDWRSHQESEIVSVGLPPGDDRESAVILSLWPGSYTAIVRGKNNTSGNALVEAYQLP